MKRTISSEDFQSKNDKRTRQECDEENTCSKEIEDGKTVSKTEDGQLSNLTSDSGIQDQLQYSSEAEKEELNKSETGQRWQLNYANMKERFDYLLTTCNLSDCTFIIGKEVKQEFKLHSLILSMASPVFEDLLSESHTHSVIDVEPDIFKQILQYIYLDYMNFSCVENTQALYRASVKFKLPHLSSKAIEYFMDKMNLDSIWPIFDAAIETQDSLLIEECSKFFKKNVLELLKHPKFLMVNHGVLQNLIEDDNLGVTEVDLLNGVHKWATYKCLQMDLPPTVENKRSILGPHIIPNLRFLSVNKELFVNSFAYKKENEDDSLLTMDESYAILMNLIIPDSHPMPEGFTLNMKPRTVAERIRLHRRLFNPLGTYYNQNSKAPSIIENLSVFQIPSMSAPIGTKNFSVEVSVNHPIVIHGIQVPTFNKVGSHKSSTEYDETYVVTIQNILLPSKPVISTMTWSGKLNYNSVMDIMFKDYIRFEKKHKVFYPSLHK
uniref:BTB domain-containing protein n=1 Tax=Clastoptera arizonana TaxID=38151 RepID=A0A1B6DCG2_9HEMI